MKTILSASRESATPPLYPPVSKPFAMVSVSPQHEVCPAAQNASVFVVGFSSGITPENSPVFTPPKVQAQPVLLGAKSSCFLGTNAKYSAIGSGGGLQADEVLDVESGEITLVAGVFDPIPVKLNRFVFQSVSKGLLPMFRVDKCLVLRQKGKEIQVLRSVEYKTASYTGLQTCGSVWVCPVCAAKIAERRRVEIISAMTMNKASGGSELLLTLTAPHQAKDDLGELLAKQAKALKYFHKDYTVRQIFKELGIIGQIRALEVTHGRLSPRNNGWHPHYHNMLFCASSVDPALMRYCEGRLYDRWAACCVRAGLGCPSMEHGLKLHDGSKAAAYASKWGLEDEMTKGHTKRALHGETPFDFLRALFENPDDEQAGVLFQEFARSFKGKRQLHWSAGLKKRFGIGEFSDVEISERAEEYSDFLGQIPLVQWHEVVRDEGRGVLLVLAANGGWPAVVGYLDGLMKKRSLASRITRHVC